MKRAELKNKIEEIRQSLIKGDLDEATEKLTKLATHFGDDAHDEAVTISANWNELERKMRSALIHENEARVRQNQLIDQILDFSRELEEGRAKEKSKTGGKSGLYVLVGILSLVILFLVFRMVSADDTDRNDKLAEQTEETTRSTSNQRDKKVEQPATKPEKVTSPAPKNAPKTTATDNQVKESNPTTKSTQAIESAESSKSKEPSPDRAKYDEFFANGVKAYKKEEYEKSYDFFQSALKIKQTEEVRAYIRKMRDPLYNRYRIRGMDLFNVGKYAEAKKEFLQAQQYVDIPAIRGLITKCNRRME